MYSVKMRANQHDIHISGAETLCEASELPAVLQTFYQKGFFHQNGQPDFMNLKIEKVTSPVLRLPALSIIDDSNADLTQLCRQNGITEKALNQGWSYIKNATCYRGAVILCAETGKRLDKTNERGVRATRFAFKQNSEEATLNDRVQDALAIATILSHNPNVRGELCVSDDLHYTTGYFATSQTGYHRLHHLKEDNTREGGRVIFADENIDIQDYIHFIEEIPKLITYSEILNI